MEKPLNEYSLNLTANDVDLIHSTLLQQPMARVEGLVQRIRLQVKTQEQAHVEKLAKQSEDQGAKQDHPKPKKKLDIKPVN